MRSLWETGIRNSRSLLRNSAWLILPSDSPPSLSSNAAKATRASPSAPGMPLRIALRITAFLARTLESDASFGKRKARAASVPLVAWRSRRLHWRTSRKKRWRDSRGVPPMPRSSAPRSSPRYHCCASKKRTACRFDSASFGLLSAAHFGVFASTSPLDERQRATPPPLELSDCHTTEESRTKMSRTKEVRESNQQKSRRTFK